MPEHGQSAVISDSVAELWAWGSFENDDVTFLQAANTVALSIVNSGDAADVLVFRIDNWFGSRWLGFTGKAVGAVGYRHYVNPVVPPFVHNRISASARFEVVTGKELHLAGPCPDIHHTGSSEGNFRNQVLKTAPKSSLVWVSGNTTTNDRGALMIYLRHSNHHQLHYVGFRNTGRGAWVIDKHLTIDPRRAPKRAVY